jgi:hypothetical protein
MAVVLALCVAFTCAAAQAAEVAGVLLADRVRLTDDGPELFLNGAGLRTKVIFKIYVAGLYLPEKKPTAAEVLALKGPKRVLLMILRELSAEQLVEALHDGLKFNASPDELARMKPQIAALDSIMLAAKKVDKGNSIAFDYLPASGTRITINGEVKGAPIPGEDFYKAVLKIWIGEQPVELTLRDAMLGVAPQH